MKRWLAGFSPQRRAARNAEQALDKTARIAAQPSYYTNKQKAYGQRLRALVLAAYGGACACCGESEPIFLQVDHIEGGGREHFAEIGMGPAFYRWLRDRGFPKDRFRLLCGNCNMAVRWARPCPHEVARVAEALLVA